MKILSLFRADFLFNSSRKIAKGYKRNVKRVLKSSNNQYKFLRPWVAPLESAASRCYLLKIQNKEAVSYIELIENFLVELYCLQQFMRDTIQSNQILFSQLPEQVQEHCNRINDSYSSLKNQVEAVKSTSSIIELANIPFSLGQVSESLEGLKNNITRNI